MNKPELPYPLLALFLSLLLSGCTKDAVFSYKLSGPVLYNENNAGKTPVDALSDKVAAKAYAIRMEFTGTITGSNNGYTGDYPSYVNSNTPVNLDIYSLTAFDAAHPALAPLNDCFYYLADTTGYFAAPISSANFYVTINFGTDYSVGGTAKGNGYLLLLAAPAAMGYRTFVVNISYADSTKTSDTISVNLL